jgi:methanogenic corrinoid protein MtbC1
MDQDLMVERFFETLINGDRPAARTLVTEVARAGLTPQRLIAELYWPTYGLIERLHREDQLTRLSFQLATRLLRVLSDRTASELTLSAPRGKTVFACCGPTDCDELGAQMAVDLLESSGFAVTFAGGGLPADEILAQTHEARPDILLMFASGPSDLPGIRHLIDTFREIAAVPNMQIAVGGGVFNRAEGLAEEIGIHLHASSPMEIVELLAGGALERPVEERREVTRRRRTRNAA